MLHFNSILTLVIWALAVAVYFYYRRIALAQSGKPDPANRRDAIPRDQVRP